MSTSRHDPARFPVGAAVRLEDLDENPYPIFERLRREEPVSWLPALGMWYVTRYEDVRAILMDADNYTTASPDSLIYDTFGEQVLSSEGARHDRYRKAVQPAFMPGHVRKHYEEAIRTATRN